MDEACWSALLKQCRVPDDTQFGIRDLNTPSDILRVTLAYYNMREAIAYLVNHEADHLVLTVTSEPSGGDVIVDRKVLLAYGLSRMRELWVPDDDLTDTAAQAKLEGTEGEDETKSDSPNSRDDSSSKRRAVAGPVMAVVGQPQPWHNWEAISKYLSVPNKHAKSARADWSSMRSVGGECLRDQHDADADPTAPQASAVLYTELDGTVNTDAGVRIGLTSRITFEHYHEPQAAGQMAVRIRRVDGTLTNPIMSKAYSVASALWSMWR